MSVARQGHRTRGSGAGGLMREKIDAGEETSCKAVPMKVPIKRPKEVLAIEFS